MLRVCALSLLVFHFGNAASIVTADYASELEPSYTSNDTLIRTDSIAVEARATVDANGCSKCSRTYLVGKQKVNFNKAVLLCNQIGMEIASPMSAKEEKAIEHTAYKTAPGRSVLWIGAKRCTGCLSEFIWITSGKPVVYRDFQSNQPDNSGNTENCIEIVQDTQTKTSYGWNDVNCDTERGFVCQSRCCCNNN